MVAASPNCLVVDGSGHCSDEVVLRSDLLSVEEFPVLVSSVSSELKIVDSASVLRGLASSGLRSGSVVAGLGAAISCSGLGPDSSVSVAPVVLGLQDPAGTSVLSPKVSSSSEMAVGSVPAGLRGSAASVFRSGTVESPCSGFQSDGSVLAASPVLGLKDSVVDSVLSSKDLALPVLGLKDSALGSVLGLKGSGVDFAKTFPVSTDPRFPEVSASGTSAAGLDLITVGSKVAGSGGAVDHALLAPSGAVTGGLTTAVSGITDAVNQSIAMVPKKSWISVASKASLSKFDFAVSNVNGKAVVDVPDEALEGTPLWEDFLIGRFASTAPHIAKIHVIVNKIWTLGDKSIKIDAFRINDTTVKFRIRNFSARLRALRRGMWNICEIPMVVSKWSPFVDEAQPAIKSMPMWVKILNVPHSMFTWKGISFLASPVGTPLRLHPETELVTNFDEAKVFVEVDLSKELPKSYFFNIRGSEVNVNFEYPWLPQRCDSCAKWGHGSDGCLAKGVQPQATTPLTSPVSAVAVPGNETSPLVRMDVRETPSDKGITEAETEVNKVSLDMSLENGETHVSPPKELISGLVEEDDGGWEITSSGRKTSRNPRTLAFGHVTILSPSRFVALQDENAADGADVGLLKPTAEGKSSQASSELDKGKEVRKANVPILPRIKSGSEETGLRPSLPRNSKSTQKPRDGLPGNINKRNSRKKKH